MGFQFTGPYRYVKCHATLTPLKNPDIIHGSLKVSGRTHVLEENRFRVQDGRNSGQIYVYHSYSYPDASGGRCSGRWYHTSLLPTDFQLTPEGEFQYTVEAYEDEDPIQTLGQATVRLQFTPKAASWFQQVIEEA
jgi:hypothetical protein